LPELADDDAAIATPTPSGTKSRSGTSHRIVLLVISLLLSTGLALHYGALRVSGFV
jgi:hypothetical protein